MSHSKRDMDTIIKLACAVGAKVQLIMKSNPEARVAFEQQMASDCESEDWDFQYAESLFRWHGDGRNSNSYFSTASPILLACRKELQTEFGLEIVDPKTGIKRENAQPTFRTVVDGWGSGYQATEQQLKDQFGRDILFLKKNKISLLN